MRSAILLVLIIIYTAGTDGRIWFEGEVHPATNYTIGSGNSSLKDTLERLANEERQQLAGIISKGLGRLALNLQGALAAKRPSTNTLFSPLSITLALALLLLGAKNHTYREINEVLGLPSDLSNHSLTSLHSEFSRLFHLLEEKPTASSDVLLTLASGVFVQENFTVNPNYINSSKSLYHSDVMQLDFTYKGREALQTINNWVLNRTDGHIKNLLTHPLSFETRVVIVNAIYFNGGWEVPFMPQWTNRQKFFVSPKSTVDVDMMVNVADAYFFEDNEKNKVLGLPYKGGSTVLYCVLPSSELSDYINTLNSTKIHELINATRMVKQVIYAVPKMKLEKTLSLRETLETLGAFSLFSHNADLSDLAEGVYASSVVHKVEVEVNEVGTSASAATAVDLVRTAGPLVRLDKPFAFFIYHQPTGIITFWGTVYNPNEN